VTQSPENNNIGLAESRDWQAISSCVRAAYAHYVPRIGREPAPMTADYRTLIARSAVYVFREQKHVRGVLVIVPEPGAMFIENVAVHPEYQGRGIGRRLLLYAEQLARNAGLMEMRLYTNELMTENIAYYHRLGYEEVERRTEQGFRRVFMRKILLVGRGE
jgi:ribosomal protein S18 acetylase RimI-like enzyme